MASFYNFVVSYSLQSAWRYYQSHLDCELYRMCSNKTKLGFGRIALALCIATFAVMAVAPLLWTRHCGEHQFTLQCNHLNRAAGGHS